MNVILSTFGPLHLIKGANYICNYVNLTILQGWLPPPRQQWLVNLLSKIIHKDLNKSFKKRKCDGALSNIGLALPEFFLWFGKMVPYSGFTNDKAARLYGFLCKKHIHNASIFHVRAGNGRGGAIVKAKKEGMRIVVDASIAHNAFIEKVLKPEYDNYNMYWGFGPDSPFWKQVLEDCQDSDVLLVNSDFVKRTFVNEGYDPNKIKVAYLGVRKDFYSLKKDYKISSNAAIKVLFTGGFGFRKGGYYLLEAIHKIHDRGIKVELYIVGSFADERKILSRYDADYIHYIGFVPQDELKQYLTDCDMYVFPSLAEGCASSGMEALAAGIPVIATEESGLPLTNGKNGIIIPQKDSEAIIDAILKLSKDERLRIELGTNASEMIQKEYTWEQYAKSVIECYKHALN